MNTQNNLFWDYCKTENNEEEKSNVALQSRSYDETYNSLTRTGNLSLNNAVKTEPQIVHNEQISENTVHEHSNKTVNNRDVFHFTDNSKNDGFQVISSNSRLNSTELTENDEKPNVSSESSIYIKEKSCPLTECKIELGTSVTVLKDYVQTDDTDSKHSVKNKQEIGNKLVQGMHYDSSADNDVLVKFETKSINKEEANSDVIIFPLDQSSALYHNKCDVYDSAVVAKEENISNALETLEDNILTKYSFSKTFINQLYLEKYESLQKTLDKEELEKKELEEELEKEDERSVQSLVLSNETEMDSRYNVCDKSQKEKNAESNQSDEVMILLSETESDSEDSILEVPIPPKPQPPIIKLTDSDEETGICSNDEDEQCSPVARSTATCETNLMSTTEEPIDNTVTSACLIDRQLLHEENEDIVLNCTEIQKSASSIKQIKELSKSVELGESNSQNNEVKNLAKSNKDNDGAKSVPASEAARNVTYERDKVTTGVSFTEDDCNVSKKRRCEDEEETQRNAKQKKYSSNEKVHAQTSNAKTTNIKKTVKGGTWTEYFFSPMSENLKAFYTESRGQENFDIREIQSKMSKDPRLWAILDEDLMPHLAKKGRSSNVRCNHCHREGHQRYNCPVPRRPPRCHMCGTQGHTESRCPQKICLTCGKKQGTFRKTCESCRTLFCNMCRAIGHKSTECPDLWRRFHQTTQNTEISIPENITDVMKPADLLYCCNCAKRGHDSSTCHEYRWSPHFPTPAFVSNYKDGPRCENRISATSTDGGLIPLSKNSKHKESKSSEKNSEPGDSTNDKLVYLCGTFHLKQSNAHEIKKNISFVKEFKTTGFLQGLIRPEFLDALLQKVNFEVKVYIDNQKNVILRVRGNIKYVRFIYDLITHWLKLDDDEKNASIHLELPMNKTDLFRLLNSKLSELNRVTSWQEPKSMWKQITELKTVIAHMNDAARLSAAKRELIRLQTKFIFQYYTQPTDTKTVVKFKNLVKSLLSDKEIKEIDTFIYLRILVPYNKIFVPRTLPTSEVYAYFSKYSKFQRDKKKGKGIPKEKKKKKGNQTQNKQLKSHIDPWETNSATDLLTNAAQMQQYQMYSAQIHVPNFSLISSNVNSNSANDVAYSVHQNIPIIEHDPRAKKVSMDKNNYPVLNVPDSCNRVGPNYSDITAVPSCSNNISFNPIMSVPLCNMSLDISSNQLQNSNPHPSSVFSTETGHTQYNINSGNESSSITTSNLITLVDPNKKKLKRQKNTEDDVNDAPLSKKAALKVSLEKEARNLINEAIAFKVPYMNKAVAEVEKKLESKRIKRKHIDALQQLVSLEKVHQKNINSVCSNLD